MGRRFEMSVVARARHHPGKGFTKTRNFQFSLYGLVNTAAAEAAFWEPKVNQFFRK
jgi:hypothetical protein